MWLFAQTTLISHRMNRTKQTLVTSTKRTRSPSPVAKRTRSAWSACRWLDFWFSNAIHDWMGSRRIVRLWIWQDRHYIYRDIHVHPPFPLLSERLYRQRSQMIFGHFAWSSLLVTCLRGPWCSEWAKSFKDAQWNHEQFRTSCWTSIEWRVWIAWVYLLLVSVSPH